MTQDETSFFISCLLHFFLLLLHSITFCPPLNVAVVFQPLNFNSSNCEFSFKVPPSSCDRQQKPLTLRLDLDHFLLHVYDDVHHHQTETYWHLCAELIMSMSLSDLLFLYFSLEGQFWKISLSLFKVLTVVSYCWTICGFRTWPMKRFTRRRKPSDLDIGHNKHVVCSLSASVTKPVCQWPRQDAQFSGISGLISTVILPTKQPLKLIEMWTVKKGSDGMEC